MIAPRIHMNGTSKNDLTMNQIYPATRAINAAIEALRETAPHARDYYVIGPDAYQQARNEYVQRLLALETVNAELHAMFGAIEAGEIEFSLPAQAEMEQR